MSIAFSAFGMIFLSVVHVPWSFLFVLVCTVAGAPVLQVFVALMLP
jgi:hypothetical protein